MDSLPDEIWLKIASKLEYPEILVLSDLSARYNFIYDDRIFWKEKSVKDFHVTRLDFDRRVKGDPRSDKFDPLHPSQVYLRFATLAGGVYKGSEKYENIKVLIRRAGRKNDLNLIDYFITNYSAPISEDMPNDILKTLSESKIKLSKIPRTNIHHFLNKHLRKYWSARSYVEISDINNKIKFWNPNDKDTYLPTDYLLTKAMMGLAEGGFEETINIILLRMNDTVHFNVVLQDAIHLYLIKGYAINGNIKGYESIRQTRLNNKKDLDSIHDEQIAHKNLISGLMTGNQVELVKKYCNNNRPTSKDYYKAGLYGAIDVIQFCLRRYIHTGNITDVSGSIIRGASEGGHLNILNLIFSISHYIKDDCIMSSAYAATKNRHQHVIDFWLNNFFRFQETLNENYKRSLVQFLGLFIPSAVDGAAFGGHLDIIESMYEKYEETLSTYLVGGSAKITDFINIAIINGDPDIVKYFIRKCPDFTPDFYCKSVIKNSSNIKLKKYIWNLTREDCVYIYFGEPSEYDDNNDYDFIMAYKLEGKEPDGKTKFFQNRILTKTMIKPDSLDPVDIVHVFQRNYNVINGEEDIILKELFNAKIFKARDFRTRLDK